MNEHTVKRSDTSRSNPPSGVREDGGQPVNRRLLSIKEVADYTGLSVHTLYTMVSQRRIPYVKAGRLTKFDRGLLDAWIAKHTVMPMGRPIGGQAAKPMKES